MTFDYCKFQVNLTHIYINLKRGCPCKERQKHVLLSMNRSKYATKLQLKYNLITSLIDNCSISVTLEFTTDNYSFIYKNAMSQNWIDNNHLNNFKCPEFCNVHQVSEYIIHKFQCSI